MARRHDARLAAVGLVYAYSMGNVRALSNPEAFLKFQNIKGKQAEFSLFLIQGFLANEKQIDDLIAKNLKNWSFDRLGAVERAILRICTFEILHTETETGIVINEALEIAKKLTEEKAQPLINAVLDKIKTKEQK